MHSSAACVLRRRAASVSFLVLSLCVEPRGLALGQPAIEQRLSSADAGIAKEALKEVLRTADRTTPMALMLAATLLLDSGQPDQAYFWFYAGQLRGKYVPDATGQSYSATHEYALGRGLPINQYAARDLGAAVATMHRVLEWDESTYPAWARANNIDPTNPELLQRRAEVREGLVGLSQQYSEAEKAQRDNEALLRRNR